MITVGTKVQFEPFIEATGFASGDYKGRVADGTVIYVNEENRWFSGEYISGGAKLRTSFNFSQIGEDVKVCGK